MDAAGKLEKVRLKVPVAAGDLSGLKIGTVVYLDGVVYTGREGVYRKVVEEGAALPVADLARLSNVNFHCSPAAAVRPDGSYHLGAVTAFQVSGCKVVIGKGGMKPEDYRRYFVPQGAIYLTTVGYGTGALLGRGVTRVREVHWLEELGIAQAMWVLEVANFGPFLVESDLEGNSLFERENAKIAAGLPKLYEGTRPAILRRYGETDDREDEVI
jgi:L(+)-tartrate dehydratase beta subunit